MADLNLGSIFKGMSEAQVRGLDPIGLYLQRLDSISVGHSHKHVPQFAFGKTILHVFEGEGHVGQSCVHVLSTLSYSFLADWKSIIALCKGIPVNQVTDAMGPEACSAGQPLSGTPLIVRSVKNQKPGKEKYPIVTYEKRASLEELFTLLGDKMEKLIPEKILVALG